MPSFWGSACSNAAGQPLQSLLNTAYISCGITVATFCIAAAASAVLYWRWFQMDAECRQRVWRLYGWFTGLTYCGSCCGAVAWLSQMQYLVAFFTVESRHSLQALGPSQQLWVIADGVRWLAVLVITYALECFCLSAAKLMVLDRMMHFALPPGGERRWASVGRAVLCGVVAMNAAGVVGNVAAAVYWSHAADYYAAAAAALAANHTDASQAFLQLVIQNGGLAADAETFQQFSQVAVLLLIIVSFAAVGTACAQRVSFALRIVQGVAGHVDQAAVAGKLLLQRIVFTSAFVFVTFLLRAAYSTMFAVASALQNNGDECAAHAPDYCDVTCFNVYALMQHWLIYTPEFQLAIVFTSSPLSLLVALWGMTNERTLQAMALGKRQLGASGQSMLRGSA
jgi:hypothetical protein